MWHSGLQITEEVLHFSHLAMDDLHIYTQGRLHDGWKGGNNRHRWRHGLRQDNADFWYAHYNTWRHECEFFAVLLANKTLTWCMIESIEGWVPKGRRQTFYCSDHPWLIFYSLNGWDAKNEGDFCPRRSSHYRAQQSLDEIGHHQRQHSFRDTIRRRWSWRSCKHEPKLRVCQWKTLWQGNAMQS